MHVCVCVCVAGRGGGGTHENKLPEFHIKYACFEVLVRYPHFKCISFDFYLQRVFI